MKSSGQCEMETTRPKTSDLNAVIPQKYIVVTGGTISGVGKGTTMSSLGVILKAMGFNVTAIKIDPYLNVDAGTMSPYEHGEVYVLEDGGEVDLDLGNYERFLDVTLTQDHNITTGKINQKVLRDERAGRYLGQTVQMIPHVTDTIQEWIKRVSKIVVDTSRHEVPQICLIEVGGTVGDIESLTYLEALQQFSMSVGQSNFCLCHVSYIPEIGSGLNREQKTKPTQHSIKELMRLGLRPDFIFCRSQKALSLKAKEKIGLFGQVALENIINVYNLSNIYLVPTMIDQQNFGLSVCKKFNITPSQAYLNETKQQFVKSPTSCLTGKQFPHYSLSKFESIGKTIQLVNRFVTIGIVGKYTGFEDAYLSVIRALHHACIHFNVSLKIHWIDSPDLESKTCEKAWKDMRSSDGILCPGGFGDRGIEGKMVSANFCRHNNVPYLGICLGMQTAIIDFCRDELNLPQADSEEFNKDALDKVIVFMPEINTQIKGGTMRLGNRATIFRDPTSLACRIYKNTPVIYERHRHRYEVNTHYVSAMESKGLCFVGQDDRGQRMEVAELKNHPFFLLVQFHPEFTSRLIRPNPCFLGFIEASLKI